MSKVSTIQPKPDTCPTWCAGCRPDDLGHSRPLVTIRLDGSLNGIAVDRIGEALFSIRAEGEMTAGQALNLVAELIVAVRSLEVSS